MPQNALGSIHCEIMTTPPAARVVPPATAFFAGTLCAAGQAAAEIKTEIIDYKQGETVLEGYLAFDAAAAGKRPGILLVHRATTPTHWRAPTTEAWRRRAALPSPPIFSARVFVRPMCRRRSSNQIRQGPPSDAAARPGQPRRAAAECDGRYGQRRSDRALLRADARSAIVPTPASALWRSAPAPCRGSRCRPATARSPRPGTRSRRCAARRRRARRTT